MPPWPRWYIIHFYTQSVDAVSFFIPVLGEPLAKALFNRSSLLLISLFFVVFSLKNIAACSFITGKSRFAYTSVAARISRNNMQQYLGVISASYIHTDSSVLTRIISLQPLEFSQHVLFPTQQVFTEAVLIVLAITAILVFNAQLFFVLLLILLPPVFLAAWLTKRKRGIAPAIILKTAAPVCGATCTNPLPVLLKAIFITGTGSLPNDMRLRNNKLNKHQADLQALLGLPRATG